MSAHGIDSTHFRQILGHYPTGVCAVTSILASGVPVGMTIGSFTSVSLDPPLVAFFPDRKSTTWPKISQTGRFCVNVLASSQQDHCRLLAAKVENKFEMLSYRLSNRGLPILDGIIAWIDCDIESVQEVGDHYFVLGRVNALESEVVDHPLIFLRGGYGHFLSTDASSMHTDR